MLTSTLSRSTPSTSSAINGRRDGWTLIELLAVLVIVAILASVTIPVYQSARAHSNQTECSAKLRNLGVSGLMLIQESGGRMLDAMYWRAPSQNYAKSVLPYLGYTDAQRETDAPTALSCPATFAEIGPNPDWNRTYSINIYACGSENGRHEGAPPYYRHYEYLNQVPEVSMMAFFMDGNILVSGAAERKVGLASVENPWNPKTKTGFYHPHPGETFNVVFLDGHVETLTLEDIPRGSAGQEVRMQPFWGSME